MNLYISLTNENHLLHHFPTSDQHKMSGLQSQYKLSIKSEKLKKMIVGKLANSILLIHCDDYGRFGDMIVGLWCILLIYLEQNCVHPLCTPKVCSISSGGLMPLRVVGELSSRGMSTWDALRTYGQSSLYRRQ